MILDSEEQWADIPGYEGLYQVSDMGRVRSLRNNTRIKDKMYLIMKQKLDDKGYFRVNLYKNKSPKTFLVSRLVAQTFIPNPENMPMVGHNNDIKSDNRVTNLYWTNALENNHHNGKYDQFIKERNLKMNIIVDKLSKPVKGTNLSTGDEVYYKSTQDASRNGFDNGKISLCCRGKRNSHKGYKWEYVNKEDVI